MLPAAVCGGHVPVASRVRAGRARRSGSPGPPPLQCHADPWAVELPRLGPRGTAAPWALRDALDPRRASRPVERATQRRLVEAWFALQWARLRRVGCARRSQRGSRGCLEELRPKIGGQLGTRHRVREGLTCGISKPPKAFSYCLIAAGMKRARETSRIDPLTDIRSPRRMQFSSQEVC